MKEGRLSDVDGCEALTNTFDRFKCDVEGYGRFVHICNNIIWLRFTFQAKYLYGEARLGR